MIGYRHVDVWLGFGSFVYGLEGIIRSYSNDTMDIEITCEDPSHQTEVDDFLSQICANPKGLVTAEARVYEKSQDEEPLVCLRTDHAPLWSAVGASGSILRLIAISGAQESDKLVWRQLSEVANGYES